MTRTAELCLSAAMMCGNFTCESLLRNISMVFQNVYLFQDSVENNIKFGCPEATHEQVVAAAKAACCHDFIMALPQWV